MQTPTIDVIRVSNPSYRAEYEENLPSKQQRRDNLANQPSLCWGCLKVVPREKLSVCVKCKAARYCNKECQRTHWRAEHKSQCAPAPNPHINDIILKLAENAMADTYIKTHISLCSILCLDLVNDRSNAKRFAVNVICDTSPADTMAYISQLALGGNIDQDGPVRLAITSIRRVPSDEIPVNVQKVVTDSSENITQDPSITALTPVVTLYFSCSEGYGLLRGETVAVMEIPEWQLEFMAEKPTLTAKSAIFGESEREVDLAGLRGIVDNYIELDRDNKLRLRVHRDGTTWQPTGTARQG